MLYLIGLGLGDAKDITVKGLEVVRRCSRVYLEAYTSVLTVGKEALEEFYGRKLILADREEVEQEADNIFKDADVSDVAFLVVGDPFGKMGFYLPSQASSISSVKPNTRVLCLQLVTQDLCHRFGEHKDN